VGIYLLVLIPKWTVFWSQFLEGLPFPKALIFVLSLSNIVKNFAVIIIPGVLAMLWLDGLIHARLLESRFQGAATLWASGVTVMLFAVLVFLAWGLSSPCGSYR
jgi:hypothetical protein